MLENGQIADFCSWIAGDILWFPDCLVSRQSRANRFKRQPPAKLRLMARQSLPFAFSADQETALIWIGSATMLHQKMPLTLFVPKLIVSHRQQLEFFQSGLEKTRKLASRDCRGTSLD
jgi:hypothetical protein